MSVIWNWYFVISVWIAETIQMPLRIRIRAQGIKERRSPYCLDHEEPINSTSFTSLAFT